MIRLGLFLYDRLGGRGRLPKSVAVNLQEPPYRAQLQPGFTRGFAYSDCWGDDSRLVIANAQDARERGATILTRTRVVGARREDLAWTVQVQKLGGAGTTDVRAKILVNATGSWAGRMLENVLKLRPSSPLRLVKGSHIVTRRLYEGDHAYILQNADRRIVFAVPYEDRFTLIGTTDVAWEGELDRVEVDDAEVDYLCRSINRYFTAQIAPSDVVWRYSGLRPLYDDEESEPSAISRDYVLQLDVGKSAAPVLSVFGGKITTHRALAEAALDKLLPYLPGLGAAWTGRSVLPGGDVPDGDLERLAVELAKRAKFLSANTARRWARAYGTRAFQVLGPARTRSDLGEDFGEGFTEAEADYLRREEWAVTAEDILWRRSKLGLHIASEGAGRLAAWLGRAPHDHGRPTQDMRIKV